MATSSEVQLGLAGIAAAASMQRKRLEMALATAGDASEILGGLLAANADIVATIGAYGTTDAFEAYAKARLAKLSAELDTLKAAADTIAETRGVLID
jgi:hypothetical protein